MRSFLSSSETGVTYTHTEGGEGSLIHYTSDLVINSHDLKNIIRLSVQLLE